MKSEETLMGSLIILGKLYQLSHLSQEIRDLTRIWGPAALERAKEDFEKEHGLITVGSIFPQTQPDTPVKTPAPSSKEDFSSRGTEFAEGIRNITIPEWDGFDQNLKGLTRDVMIQLGRTPDSDVAQNTGLNMKLIRGYRQTLGIARAGRASGPKTELWDLVKKKIDVTQLTDHRIRDVWEGRYES